MKVKNGFTNDTDFVHSDFIGKNPAVAIPYIILTAFSMVVGCIGNSIVIGGVLIYPVSEVNAQHGNFSSLISLAFSPFWVASRKLKISSKKNVMHAGHDKVWKRKLSCVCGETERANYKHSGEH